jgi:hypothetical protein
MLPPSLYISPHDGIASLDMLDGSSLSVAEARIVQQRATQVDSASAARHAASHAAAANILLGAGVCPVTQRRHQLARTVLPVALLLLADASSL